MGKLYNSLLMQLKNEEHKKDAEDCLCIYNKLKEINNGKVWSSQWNTLVDTKYPVPFSNKRLSKPNDLGYVFKNIKIE